MRAGRVKRGGKNRQRERDRVERELERKAAVLLVAINGHE